MTNLLILGTNGRIARLTAYPLRADRLPVLDPSRETIPEGDTNDYFRLFQAMQSQTMVLTDLGG